ncbi:acetate--CoA ligase family protein [Rhodococcus sp. DMU1]|uniref:acetate--CoA ligase family protein n=1 Tax=Rhodococcus sp. DMU1 TaxID=2722825 RepID=UPI00143E6E50|nr:acetate--CoA ligase family protein [Rhodococcus sp. DMU1]QIX53626.1 acetate--CoA ligase family protein [Rhodococcus sp. DMU1]
MSVISPSTTSAQAAARVASLMESRRVAIVGASERSMFLRHLIGSIDGAGGVGSAPDVHLVNPNAQGLVFGRETVRSVADLPRDLDLAFIAVGAPRVIDAVEQIADHGIRNAVVLSGGFAEAGDEESRALQAELVRVAEQREITLLGPNTLGFLNNTTGLIAMGTRLPTEIPTGDIAIISQSGAVGSTLVNFAAQDQIGVSWVMATGNEAMLTASDAVAYAAEDEHTRVIALYLESVRHADEFLAAVAMANQAGKRVIACKVGRGSAAARVAAAHTGGIAGDDDVVEAAFRQHGIIRVYSAEELVYTAGVASATGGAIGRRIGFISMSGGFCAQAADLGERAGLEFPEFGAETIEDVSRIPEAPGVVNNPLDTTGTATTRVGALADITEAVAGDSRVDALMLGVPAPHTPEALANHLSDVVAEAAERLSTSTVPTFFVENISARTSQLAANYFRSHNARFLSGGLAHVVRALGRLAERTEWEATRAAAPHRSAPLDNDEAINDTDPGPQGWDEVRTRDYLASRGVTVVPGEHVMSEADALVAADRLGYPVVVKAVGAALQHKSDMGGVVLGIGDADELRAAYKSVQERIIAATGTPPDGVLISPMRSSGIELIVGVVADPTWGHTLAVGLGGVWTEAMKDVSLRVLPVTAADVQEMLTELRASILLDGYRGGPSVDREGLVQQILAVARAARTAPRPVLSLEVNPVLASGDRIEALDALVEWSD